MARFKPVSYAQTLMVPIILEKQLVPGNLRICHSSFNRDQN